MNSILKGLALDDVTRSIIMVAGVGGAGGNALNHMVDLGINDVTFLACNTDAQALDDSRAGIKIQLGSGLGAGNDPEKGSQAAKESIDDIINVLRTEGTRMLFITAGMGGGTGTGASPIIAQAAQELDILTVAIVTTPFTNEGPRRSEQAKRGIEALKQHTDSLLVLSNDSIEQLYPDLPYDEGFWRADDVLSTAVKGIAEIITGHGTINVDFADVNTVMRGSGRAFMGSGRAEGDNRALDAVESSVSSLLLNHRDIVGAKNILLNISYGDVAVTQREAGSIRNYLQESTGWTANLIWGTAHKPSLGGDLELTIIATGFPATDDEVMSVMPPRVVVAPPAAPQVTVEKPREAEYPDHPAAGAPFGAGRIYRPEPEPAHTPGPGHDYRHGAYPENGPHTVNNPWTANGSHTLNEAVARQQGLHGAGMPHDEGAEQSAAHKYPSPVGVPAPHAAPAARHSTSPDTAQPHSGTVQWRGVDRYADIDDATGTPAWVRRKATLGNPHEGRATKASIEKGPQQEADTNSLFDK